MEQLTSVEKALDVLFHLHGAGGPQGVTRIGEALQLPKSTTHRLLAALVGRGLVEQDGHGRYQPGVALVALGLGILDGEPVVAAARPVLEREAERLGETLFLATTRGGRVVVLDKVEGTGFLRAAPQVGSEVPVHATAVGKLYLAFAPDTVDRTGTLRRYTPLTLTSHAALERQVRQVRRQGFAENREEWMPGLAVIAAPVQASGRLAAAVALAAPAARLPAKRRSLVADKVMRAAAEIARRLEGRPQ